MGKFSLLLCLLVAAHLPSTSKGQISRVIEALAEILGIASNIDGALNGVAIRHPESGGKCMDIKGAFPFSGGQVIVYQCEYPLGLTPVNQRYSIMSGATDDSVRLRPEFSHVSNCVYAGREDNDPLFTIDCNDGDQERLSWRFLDVSGRDPRVLLQQVASGRCAKPDGDSVRVVGCNQDDVQQHWIRCRSGDQGCGF